MSQLWNRALLYKMMTAIQFWNLGQSLEKISVFELRHAIKPILFSKHMNELTVDGNKVAFFLPSMS